MNAIAPIAFPVQPRKSSAIRRRVSRLHEDAANGIPEAVCAILLASCLITALGQCLTQIVA